MKQPDYALLYTAHRSLLLAYARHRYPHLDAAEDVVQHVFLQLLEREANDDIRNWKAYLFILMRNELVNYTRKEDRRRRLLSGYESLQPKLTSHDPLLEKEYRGKLLATIATLPPHQSLVFELRCVYNWKYAKVAQAMDISPQTVKKHMQVIRKKLLLQVA
jgi:RNA polymerase sigma factor (sigma-70 family)